MKSANVIQVENIEVLKQFPAVQYFLGYELNWILDIGTHYHMGNHCCSSWIKQMKKHRWLGE